MPALCADTCASRMAQYSAGRVCSSALLVVVHMCMHVQLQEVACLNQI